MNQNSNPILTAFISGGVALVIIVLIYVAGMPTTRRMDAVVLTMFISTTVGLTLVYLAPRLYNLAIAILFAWLAVTAVGVIAGVVLLGTLLWKTTPPLLSQQWYALAGLVGIVGALMALLVYLSLDDYDQLRNQAAFRKRAAQEDTTLEDSVAAEEIDSKESSSSQEPVTQSI